MTAPFLEIDQFETEFGRTLSEGQELTAKRLLQVVSDWIRDNAPVDVSVDAAIQVTFEVVRDSLNYGDYELLSSFTNTTADRTKSGTFDADLKAIDDYLTDRHKRLLGIIIARATAVGSFPVCDY